jgi:hypothetical protein
MIRNFICFMAACAIGACNVTPAAPGAAARPETVAEATAELEAPPAERFIAPTAAMLAAALRGDPDAMASAAAPSTCNAANTCPAQYGSPTAWSTAFECAEVCDAGNCPPGEGKHGIAYNNSFRVKFDCNGNSCTEWRVTTQPFCGCF